MNAMCTRVGKMEEYSRVCCLYSRNIIQHSTAKSDIIINTVASLRGEYEWGILTYQTKPADYSRCILRYENGISLNEFLSSFDHYFIANSSFLR